MLPSIATSTAGADTRLAGIDQTCRHGLYLVAMRSLGNEDDAREAVQEVLVRAVEALRADRVPAHVPLPSFLHGIARHVLADVIRHRVRNGTAQHDAPDRLPASAPGALDAMVTSEDRQRLVTALQRLPDDDRELLRRCYVEGEGLVEIARASGEPSERIRKRKSRAIDRLRSLMGVAGHDSPVQATERP